MALQVFANLTSERFDVSMIHRANSAESQVIRTRFGTMVAAIELFESDCADYCESAGHRKQTRSPL